jgi:hypothetical protein
MPSVLILLLRMTLRMLLPPDNLSYLIDEATWSKSIDPLKVENQKEEILNGYITRVMQQ